MVKMTRQIIIALLAMVVSVAAMAQGEQRQGRPGGFKPSIEGVWQQISFNAGQDGQPQLSFFPLLKIYSAEGSYQYIGIPNEGACFVSKSGSYEKTSDSTIVETQMRMPNDSTEAQPLTMHYRFRGPVWLVIDYMEPGKTEPTTELWMKVQPQGRRGIGQMGGQRPRMGAQGGQRGMNRGGMRGGFNRQMQQNPFMENGGGNTGGGSPDFGHEDDF